MDQVIIAPDEEWITYIAKMWLLGSHISEEITGQKMDGSMQDLDRIQAIVASGQVQIENTQELQSFGIVFGKVFVNETQDYDWWVVEDDYGKDACVRYKETSLLIFPQTMLSKRIEDGEAVDVSELFYGLRAQLELIKNESYADA
ncbi:DUF3806 domain-containing protein [Pseudomonas sp. EA_35y_Pfl2_R5]|uniref:DUF3806 domain-containing protein n=1 Tax=Pseudomonas sp. EA_35y_Pfl2_R5 TaxID=3088690 RepID=UPI0030D81D90